MEEAAIPVLDPLVLEEESAIVSETDGAPHSSDDESGLNLNWLSSTHIRNHHQDQTSAPSTTAAAATPNQNDEDENDSVDENEMKESAGPEDFYCSNMDDEDEAYVYKHLRSGREETVHVRRAYPQQLNEEQQQRGNSKKLLLNETSTEKSNGQNTSHLESTSNSDRNGTNGEEEEQELPLSTAATQTNNPQSINLLHQARLLKPRTSDAILSCPRCFNVVCMDCQQHERYSNQYRAMFVMNIGVDWTKKMMYDEAIGGLKAYTTNGGNGGRTLGGIMEGEEEDASMPDRIPHDDIMQSSSNTTEPTKEAYYSVHCSYCRLELAALDMGDEIYYFFGCIASS